MHRIALLAAARKLKGKPYEEFPCGRLIQQIYKSIGIFLPSVSIHQALMGKEILKSSVLEEGDLLFFTGKKPQRGDLLFPGRNIHIGHVAMWMGEGKIVEASSKKGRAVIRKISEKRLAKVLLIKRVLV